MSDVIVGMLAFLIGFGGGTALSKIDPPIKRLHHPLDQQAHLVRFKGDDAVWTCEPVTATEGK